MSAVDENAVLTNLSDAADFARRLGLDEDSRLFGELHKRFQSETATLKSLRRDVEPVRNEFAKRARDVLMDEYRKVSPGMEALEKENQQVSIALLNLIYPPEPKAPELDISGFRGAEHVQVKKVTYYGQDANVQSIIEKAIEIVRRYSKLIGAGNFEGAYELTDTGLRDSIDLKKFVAAHERAAKQYGGAALEFTMEQFNYVYADEAARSKSNTSVEGWAKGTPKENRRGVVRGFWIRDRAEQTGSGGSIWITEEDDKYRIAKFTFGDRN